MKKTSLFICITMIAVFLLTSCVNTPSEIEVPTLPSATVAPSAEQTPQATQTPEEEPVSFKIMFTSDIHGRISNDSEQPSFGYARIAQMKQELAEQGDVLLFSAGDVMQGTSYVNESMGATAIDLMNFSGYDAMTPGNHDFDWGGENLAELRQIAEFEMLSANILYRSDDSFAFTDNKIFHLSGGGTVGVFGLTTPTTMTTTTPSAVEDYIFLADAELYAAALQQVTYLTEQGCDLIVCLSHLGVDDTAAGSRSYDVLDNVSGIDLFIDAHSHITFEEEYKGTLLISAGAYGEYLGLATYENGQLSAELIPAVIEDDTVLAYAETVVEEVDALLEVPVAETEVLLVGDVESVRTQETNLADLTTDSLLWYANAHMSVTADVAIINGGNIRASIDEGEITLQDVKEVFPFNNTLVTLDLTGAQLLEVLEAASAYLPEVSANIAHVSGMEYIVNTGNSYREGELYPNSTFYSPRQPGHRVEIVSIGGEEFSPAQLYTIVTNDFLALGGDSYYAFTQAKEGTKIDSGVPLEDAFLLYIEEALGGVVTDDYEEPGERIEIR